jgi:pilus assembly protein CpaC
MLLTIKNASLTLSRYGRLLILFALLGAGLAPEAMAAATSSVFVPVNRSTLVTLPNPASEVLVANPDIADVHVHNANNITIIGKKLGHTNVRIMGKDGELVHEIDIVTGEDLPALRKALKNFLPEETIGVEMINTSIALTGKVSSPAAVDKAIRIAREYVRPSGQSESGGASPAAALTGAAPAAGGAQGQQPTGQDNILNFLQVTSGQQVMLRVRVGEIQRSALKTLGIDLNAIYRAQGTSAFSIGTGSGIASLVPTPSGSTAVTPGQFLLPGGQTPSNTRGVFSGVWQPGGANGQSFSGLIKALEQDGLFKVLAEPNLVAVSGEEAEFLSGGEIPIPVVQNSSGSSTSVSVEYKPFGVAVKFTPHVLGESRIRMTVQPEVSEVSNANAVTISGFTIPSIETRRAKTTVELAPGESFMIAGLINDQTRASIDQLPGAKELPVLGALFRSTEFQRNETELVIAVTPYIVDPVKGTDVKMPTDDFRPASQMEMFFFGALGTLSGKEQGLTQTPGLEGPTGFMVD